MHTTIPYFRGLAYFREIRIRVNTNSALLQVLQHMMSHRTPFIVLVAVLLINTLSHSSAENVYCVTPTATSCSSCPHNTHCTTFSEYAQEAELYFTSNTTMVFLPGDHNLDKNITVANVTRLTLRGESSSDNIATVVCSGSVGLSFTSMVDFKIDSLAFTTCNRKYAIAGILSIPPNGTTIVHVALLLHSTHAELVNCSFHDNLGTALAVNNTNITLAGNTFIHNNYHLEEFVCVSHCMRGGAITAVHSNLIFTGNTTFLENSAVSIRSSASFLEFYWGAILAYNNYTTINFNGASNFINNSADLGGAIFTYDNTTINFNGASNFINNSADWGGAIYAHTNITLTFSRTVNFTNNVAITGGGVYLGLKCTVSTLPNTTVYWENNHAYVGGAIYVQDGSPISYCTSVTALAPKEECFFQLPGQNLSSGINVKLVFTNNSADDAGSILYGGAIDNCKLTDLDSYSSGEVFDMIVHIDDDSDDNITSNISSEPIQICSCENNLPNCSKNWYDVPHAVYPGEIFQVSVVTVGQRNGTVSSEVISTIEKHPQTNSLHSKYQLQQANNTCTTFSYAVSSLSRYVWIWLHADRSPCNDILDIGVTLVQVCPPGFSLSTSARSCVCEPRLAKYTNNCTISNELGTITRNEGQQFWVGYDNQSDELILHPHCPFDYCVNDTVVFPLNNTDSQCANNRSGLLCGRCKESYSLVLGTSRCEKCTNSHLFLLISFAVMGVALVFFLLVCKLTVATGMLSGLVFYVNIVGANRTSFLPVESTNPFSIFIAWLNLDFGIETCFYNGMMSTAKHGCSLCSQYISGC